MKQAFNPKNKDLLININGELYHRDVAGISPFDSAVQGGDAVWEGLRLYEGRIFKLIPHLNRLRDSAMAMAFAEIPPQDLIIDEISKTLAANRMTDGVHIRLTLSRGVKYTSGMDTRLNTQGPDIDRSGGTQAARLRQERHPSDHIRHSAHPARLRRPEHPLLQSHQFHFGQDSSQCRGRRRRLDAGLSGLCGGDQRHTCIHRAGRRGDDFGYGLLPGGASRARLCWRYARTTAFRMR